MLVLLPLLGHHEANISVFRSGAFTVPFQAHGEIQSLAHVGLLCSPLTALYDPGQSIRVFETIDGLVKTSCRSSGEGSV
jgi:hypothetical protein